MHRLYFFDEKHNNFDHHRREVIWTYNTSASGSLSSSSDDQLAPHMFRRIYSFYKWRVDSRVFISYTTRPPPGQNCVHAPLMLVITPGPYRLRNMRIYTRLTSTHIIVFVRMHLPAFFFLFLFFFCLENQRPSAPCSFVLWPKQTNMYVATRPLLGEKWVCASSHTASSAAVLAYISDPRCELLLFMLTTNVLAVGAECDVHWKQFQKRRSGNTSYPSWNAIYVITH